MVSVSWLRKETHSMTNEEIKALMAQLQEQGLEPEEIADGVLWPLYRKGKMSKEDLSTLCLAIGLELAEDFENDDHAEPIEGEGAAEGITKEEAEAAKEIAPGESKEEFQEKVEEAAEGSEEPEEEEEDEADGSDEDEEPEEEDEEWDDVKKKIFKM